MEDRYVPVLLPLLRTARKVVVTCHVNPDGDAVAGLLALTTSLRLARLDAQAISPSAIPEGYRFLSGWETVAVHPSSPSPDFAKSRAELAMAGAEAIVSVDSTDLDRLGEVYSQHKEKFETAAVVNIDHHPTNSGFGRLPLVDVSAAAVCEHLALLMEREDLRITAEIATALLAGIVADTLSFRIAATSPRTMRVAAGLVERGASLSFVSERIFNTRSPNSLALWGRVLAGTRVEGGLVWGSITERMLGECDARMEDADNLVDFMAGVPETRGTFLFSEHSGTVRVSIRTAGELDAAELARHFGGGGHVRAAGCTLPGSLGEVQGIVLDEARRRLGLVTAGRGRAAAFL